MGGVGARLSGRAFVLALALVAAGTVAGGCVHRVNNLSGVNIDIPFTGTAKIAIVTHDQRPAVQSGERPPNVSGVIRAAVGTPYPIKTESGQDVAWELTSVVDRAFKARGFTTLPIQVAFNEPPAQVIQKLAGAQADRSVHIVIHEWHAERYMKTTLTSDLEATVYDIGGTVLGRARIQTREELPLRAMANEREGAAAVERAFQAQVNQLLNHPQIVGAFTNPVAPPPPPPPPPSPPPSPPPPSPTIAPTTAPPSAPPGSPFDPAAPAPPVTPAPPATPPVAATPENTPTACQDGADNDGDGQVDCADPDCGLLTFCAGR